MVTVIVYYKALFRFWLENVFSCFFKNKKIMDFEGGVNNVLSLRYGRLYVLIPSRDDVQIAICCFTINNERENKMAASSLTSQSIKDKRKIAGCVSTTITQIMKEKRKK